MHVNVEESQRSTEPRCWQRSQQGRGGIAGGRPSARRSGSMGQSLLHCQDGARNPKRKEQYRFLGSSAITC